ncbi:hypothetical protein GCM10011611_02450 [Aliidongia dinghuensis]|uniref:Uncharacterized protein n=1 Tax=Aliidongia dinghuensis TaxID=1867774 RepID=A0A8J2YPA1_9PROT|nr:hypothetical protein [Aliidongia dinghuensis]GGF00348.1 hypothetical protein GCM10011611_02450 [Aliidongia dinghuensis]
MSEKRETKKHQAARDFLDRGMSQLDIQRNAQAATRKRWKADAGRLLDAHLLAFSTLVSIVTKKAGQPGRTSASLSGRMSLIASFIQGVDICEVCVSEGLYFQAANLLKQELETIAAIEEFKIGQRRENRTPNISRAGPGAGPLYSDLNAAAHVADQALLSRLITNIVSAEVIGASLVPMYNREASSHLYCLHVYLMVKCAIAAAETVKETHDEEMTDLERELLNSAVEILTASGWLVAPALDVTAKS